MTCPLCGVRKARRACPALSQEICPVCCGTKRLVEIRCPDTCAYLHTARAHPPAVVQREQQRDAAVLVTTMQDLTERQQQLMFLLLGVVRRQQDDPLRRIVDTDVADATGALAATFETAAKGVIYEHQPGSLPAQRLLTELKTLLDEVSKDGRSRLVEREAPAVLRAIERGAREAGKVLPGGDRAYLDLVVRVLRPLPGASSDEAAPVAQAAQSGLILPPD